METIKLGASNVAAACGLNRYSSAEDLVEELAARYHPELGLRTRTQKIYDSLPPSFLETLETELSGIETCADVRERVYSLGKGPDNESLEDCEKRTERLKRVLCASLKGEQRRQIEKDVVSAISTSRGTQREALDLQKCGLTVHERDELLEKRFSVKKAHFEVLVRGRVDGMDDNNNVVETKHRRNRLFGSIPVYERVQLEMYMWMTSTKKCTHVENFEEHHNITLYEHDPLLWERIERGLRDFCSMYVSYVAEAKKSIS